MEAGSLGDTSTGVQRLLQAKADPNYEYRGMLVHRAPSFAVAINN